ncbi:MAG: hypothetical protein HDS77_06850 [Bacteroidales bacterium]|nr:hypothetical protein [Bacteroidales bacterium]
MSSIPNKQIDGNVAVGRNLTTGGNATVRGSASVEHNLVVRGWLDAPNIKGPNKGLFASAEELAATYPNPRAGWWALVGNTLPARVYMAVGGKWEAQTDEDGRPQFAGNPSVDLDHYTAELEQLSEDVSDAEQTIDHHTAELNRLQEDVKIAQSSAGTAQSTADAALKKATDNAANINTLLYGNVSEAIDNLNEIIAFLNGFRDDEQLATQLTDMKAATDSLRMQLKAIDNALDTKLTQADKQALELKIAAANASINEIKEDLLRLSGVPEDITSLQDAITLLQGTTNTIVSNIEDMSVEIEDMRILATEGIKECLEQIGGVAVYPFDIICSNVTGQPFEGLEVGKVAFISSRGLFAKRTESGFCYPGTHNVFNQGVEPVGAREDCLFRCGNNLYKYDGTRLSNMVDSYSVEEEHKQIQRDFIGVWDELANIKDVIAGIASNEVTELLGQLGYDSKDIADYIYFNLHGYCTVTMDELRLSAWRWTHFDELEGIPVLYVLPNLKDEWHEEGFDVSSICRPQEVKYVNYMWMRNGWDDIPPFPTKTFIYRYEVGNIKDNGELLEGEEAKLRTRPYGFIYSLSGNIGYVDTGTMSINPITRHFSTSQESVALGRGVFAYQEIDAEATGTSVDKITELLNGAFYGCTLKNFKVGSWDCIAAESPFSGCARIVDSEIVIDLKETGGYDLLKRVYVENSRIEVNNMPEVGDNRNMFFYTTGNVFNSGAKDTISEFASNNLRFTYLPSLISINDAVTILDLPNLEMFGQNHGISMRVGNGDNGERIWTDDYNGSLYYRRVFLRNIGSNPAADSLWIYQTFDITRDPTTRERNIELFVECGRTWADRTALGLNPKPIYISQVLMNALTTEQKGIFTSKGYTIVVAPNV